MVRLGTLEEDDLALVERCVEHAGRVGDVRADPLTLRHELGHDLVRLDLGAVVHLDELVVLLDEGRLDLLAQHGVVEEVLDADAHAVDLVGVRRADAATGGADLALAGEPLGDLVHRLVVAGQDVRVGADQRVLHLDAALGQGIQLLVEDVKVEDHAVAQHADRVGVEDARGQQVQDGLLSVDHDGVAGVVAAGVTGTVVDALAELVDGLSLALVTPLGADHDDARHCSLQALGRPADSCPGAGNR